MDHALPLTRTVPEAAALLGIGRNAAYEAVRNGAIPAIRIGRRWLVPVLALERLLEAQNPPAPRPLEQGAISTPTTSRRPSK
jgi:excisionase family DNA binding protein